MSERLETDARATPCRDEPRQVAQPRVLKGRKASLGPGVTLYRMLPRRPLRMVGAWCFLDHFGPLRLDEGGRGLDIAPHPHIGLHTVTWLLEGEILHRDSLGNECRIRPGQLNLMTAGQGISHSEETPGDATGRLHGLQLWLAQSETDRHGPPDFQHVAELPTGELGDGRFQLMLGAFAGRHAPARVSPPVMAAELRFGPSGRLDLPLETGFEYALTALDGTLDVGPQSAPVGTLVDLGCGRDHVRIEGRVGDRTLLLGGTPFGEEILMWWNFVAREAGEIQQAREDWMGGERFGTVAAYAGDPLPAPAFTPGLRKR